MVELPDYIHRCGTDNTRSVYQNGKQPASADSSLSVSSDAPTAPHDLIVNCK